MTSLHLAVESRRHVARLSQLVDEYRNINITWLTSFVMLERSSVEMPEMMRDKSGYWAVRGVCLHVCKAGHLPDRRRVMFVHRR